MANGSGRLKKKSPEHDSAVAMTVTAVSKASFLCPSVVIIMADLIRLADIFKCISTHNDGATGN